MLNPFKYVATPIQIYGNGDEGRRAMILLKHRILKNIVLRRTKKGRAADLALPPRIVSVSDLWLTTPPPPPPPPTGFFPFHLSILPKIFLQVSLRRDTLDIKEQDYYESLYDDSQAQFNTYVTCNLFCFVLQF
jgi:DNA repair protein RAD16